ncbi:MAG: DUF2442 domain-containing protein [Tepidisphaeraceae bacterium]|jgi:uncharacterized protein DUF2442
MRISVKDKYPTEPIGASVKDGTLSVDLADGRTISAPVKWYPRLFHGTPAEHANFELSIEGVHWPDLNEDISVKGLLQGEKSGESKKSLRRWLRYRSKGLKEPILELPLPPDLAKWLARHGHNKPRKKTRFRRRQAA